MGPVGWLIVFYHITNWTKFLILLTWLIHNCGIHISNIIQGNCLVSTKSFWTNNWFWTTAKYGFRNYSQTRETSLLHLQFGSIGRWYGASNPIIVWLSVCQQPCLELKQESTNQNTCRSQTLNCFSFVGVKVCAVSAQSLLQIAFSAHYIWSLLRCLATHSTVDSVDRNLLHALLLLADTSRQKCGNSQGKHIAQSHIHITTVWHLWDWNICNGLEVNSAKVD